MICVNALTGFREDYVASREACYVVDINPMWALLPSLRWGFSPALRLGRPKKISQVAYRPILPTEGRFEAVIRLAVGSLCKPPCDSKSKDADAM
jgi:hypothetical protein